MSKFWLHADEQSMWREKNSVVVKCDPKTISHHVKKILTFRFIRIHKKMKNKNLVPEIHLLH